MDHLCRLFEEWSFLDEQTFGSRNLFSFIKEKTEGDRHQASTSPTRDSREEVKIMTLDEGVNGILSASLNYHTASMLIVGFCF
jgi:hypothetical protein